MHHPAEPSASSVPAAARSGRFRPWRAAAMLLVLGLLTACGVRLDLPPPPAPTPEGQDAVRQEAAVAVQTLTGPARSAAESASEEVATVLNAVAGDAEVHLEALGGVWQPPPRPEDDDEDLGEETAAAASADAGSAEPADVVHLLEDTAAGFRSDLGQIDGELATLLTSIAANQVLHARQLRNALDMGPADPPTLPEDPFPAEFGVEAAELSRLLDASGYVAEVRAARSSGEERDRLIDHAEQMRAQADLVARRGGFAATSEDPREPVYELQLEDLSAQTEDLARARVSAWLHLVGPVAPEDRDLVAAQVLSTALTVH
ncbi:MAG TPA: hypothetical protein VK063_04155, partial [Beutenbergiaceae bacterium]|nr:hypothetical protein [Beutenbergiaceae bacterium]